MKQRARPETGGPEDSLLLFKEEHEREGWSNRTKLNDRHSSNFPTVLMEIARDSD